MGLTRSGFLPARVIHLHPTRACNLACLHCYSSSGPGARTSLELNHLLDALNLLKGQGYEVLSIAGGEPLVYPHLTRLVAAAADLGYQVQVVTNGLLLTKKRLLELRDYVKLIAVSFDGAETTHNLVRGRNTAFQRANTALEVLAGDRVAFGLAFGVTRKSLPDIPWAYERAREIHAGLLHLHPLVAQGRARDLSDEWPLGPADCARLYVLGKLLGALEDGPHVQVDLVPVQELAQARDQYRALLLGGGANLSDVVNPLVIDERGRCLPFTYNMDPRFAVADLRQNWRRALGEAVAAARDSLAHLVDFAFRSAHEEPSSYLDWFQFLTKLSFTVEAGSPRSRAIAVS